MVWELFWFLLPVAAATGWYTGSRRHHHTSSQKGVASDCGPNYYKGLNYLLNEQPDKAIDVFTNMLELDSETVETHTALGNLFRRRGEVDRAIRIHQNLIARSTLTRDQRAQALLELGQDYMRAGLLDRAESLFQELVEMNVHCESALRQLLSIYQSEKEWEKAIAAAQRLETVSKQTMRPQIAQFYCELAESALLRQDDKNAIFLAGQAHLGDRRCVRATMLQGKIHSEKKEYRAAIQAYKRVEHQDIEYFSVVIGPLYENYLQLDAVGEMREYFLQILKRYPSVPPLLTLTDLVKLQEGEQKAAEFIVAQLHKRPSIRGLERYIALRLPATSGNEQGTLQTLHQLMQKLLEERTDYRCTHCGFGGNTLHWQCPGCKHWSSIKPIQERGCS